MMKENKSICQEAEFYYFDYLTAEHSNESTAWFAHIDQCPECQSRVARLKEEIHRENPADNVQPRILELHHQHLSQWIDCRAVKPFLASLASSELSIRTKTPVTVHIDHCPACQDDLRTIASLALSDKQLTEATGILTGQSDGTETLIKQAAAAIQAIRNRNSSGVVTRVEINTEGEIRVEAKVPARMQSALRPARAYSFMRFSTAAAILLVIGLALFQTMTVHGVSLQNVYLAMNSIMNCQIQLNIPEQTAPIQTILISKELNIIAYQQDNGVTIQKKTPSTSLSEKKIWSQIDQAGFGLLPFKMIHQIPPGYVWKARPDLSQETAYKVYDLTWKDSTETGTVIEKTWRGYLLNDSLLPARIQWIEKHPLQLEKTIMEVSIQYPDVSTIQKELKTNPAYHLYKGDQEK